MSPRSLGLPVILLVLTIMAMSACSPAVTASDLPQKISEYPPPEITSTGTVATPSERIDSTPTSQQFNSAIVQIQNSYHVVLMVERAADLMLLGIDRIQKGQISAKDSSETAPYMNAFTLAVDAFNQANPPVQIEDPWNQVYQAVQQYRQAYILIDWAQPISDQNLSALKETRELLKIDQNMVRDYLTQMGVQPDFFTKELEGVDQHIQNGYGDTPVPLIPEENDN